MKRSEQIIDFVYTNTYRSIFLYNRQQYLLLNILIN